MANFLDTFWPADGNQQYLSTHVSDSGHSWVNQVGSLGLWSTDYINRLSFPNNIGYMVYVNLAFTNYDLNADISWRFTDGFILRLSSTSNMLRLVRTSTSVRLVKVVGGTPTTVGDWPVTAAVDNSPVSVHVAANGTSYDIDVVFSSTSEEIHQSVSVTDVTVVSKMGLYADSGGSYLRSLSADQIIPAMDMSGTATLSVAASGTMNAADHPYSDMSGQADLTASGSGALVAVLSASFSLGIDLGLLDPVVLSGAQEAGNGPRPDGPDRLELVLSFSARFALDLPLAPSLAGGTALTRAMLGVSALIPTPTVVQGRPVISPFWGVEDSTSSVTGIQIIPEPDPPPAPVTGGPGGSPVQYRWLSKDQPLNDQWIESWPAHGGGPTWHSLFPFRPKLKAHIHYGAKGKKYTLSNAVFFNPAYVEHMWLDRGHALTPPYTWIFAAIILGYPAGDSRQYLLDAGKAQKTSTIAKVRRGYDINDGLTYRNTLIADRKQLIVGTKNGAGVARAPHHYAARPRVFAGVYNGTSSYAAVMDEKSAKIVKGSTPTTKPRYFISGRKQGRIDTDDAAHFMIFEIRLIENAALSPTELRKHYKQLASTYKFNSY